MTGLDKQLKRSRFLSLWGVGCGILSICLIACMVIYFYVVRGNNGKQANTDTIQNVTQAFVVALYNNQFDSARDMFSEKLRASISMNDIESLAQEKPISDFQTLSVCEFAVNFGPEGRQIVGYGLLRYNNGTVIFESTLIQDTDSVWRIYGFYLRPNMNATPSGLCKIN